MEGGPVNKLAVGLAVAAALITSAATAQPTKPTIVLVHGAFADTSSWNAVIRILDKDGYRVVATANPLRSVQGDANYLAAVLSGIEPPVVLVGHSYGGFVISEAASSSGNVKALVYVAAFAPQIGETAAGLSNKFPGSTLGPTLAVPVSLSGGDKDLYIQQDQFPAQFAADVDKADAKIMAETQRPITVAALNEPAMHAAWRNLPSWFVYGDQDKNIPPQVAAFMAERAGSKETVVVKGASHVVMVSNAATVATLIEHAASAID
jgi:pimeloyl-ACP methyl ester carboxylesterase